MSYFGAYFGPYFGAYFGPVAAPPDAAGLEFTLPDNWAHFTLPQDSEP